MKRFNLLLSSILLFFSVAAVVVTKINHPQLSPTTLSSQSFTITQIITPDVSVPGVSTAITVQAGESVLDVLRRTATIGTKEYSFGTSVESINGVNNGVDQKYWVYYVNGQEAQVGAGAYNVQANQVIEWKYKGP